MNKHNYSGLCVAKKTYNDVRIGYVVGWWFYPRKYFHYDENGDRPLPEKSFRSFREGVIFKREADAKKFRDDIEQKRKDGPRLVWEDCDNQ